MAVVDFSNAHIEPYSTNPICRSDVSLDSGFYNSNYENLVRNPLNKTVLRNDPKKLTYQFTGQFQRAGTEIFFYVNNFTWHITGITFNPWDTFDFRITANII